MKILRSTPFVLLYISVAILVAGCVLLGSRAMLKPFNAIPDGGVRCGGVDVCDGKD